MLAGYFVMYGNHPQLKTEALLPAVLYGYESLSHSENKRGPWLCSLLIALALIAGMPEDAFFSLLLGTLWYFSRSLTNGDIHKKNFSALRSIFLRYISFTAIGFLMAAVYLLPLFEFITHGSSEHLTGASYLTSTFPLWSMTNLIYQSSLEGLQHIRLGFISIFALIYSIFSLKKWTEHRHDIIFFSVYILFFFLVLFDFPFISWIKNLPILRQIAMWKYALPSILFCSATVTGIFIDQIKREFLSYKKTAATIILILVFIIWLPSQVAPSQAFSLFYQQPNIGYFALALLGCMVIALFIIAHLSRNRRAHYLMSLSLLSLLVAEPFYWSFLINRPSRADPYQIPPFINYLRKDKEPFRVFAMDGILYPDISTAYQIADIRWLNALVPQRAYGFSTSLIAPDEPEGLRFTGTALPISDRMFDILNVKYVLSQSTIGKQTDYCESGSDFQQNINHPDFGTNTLNSIIFQQNKEYKYPGEVQMFINGSARMAIFQQPLEEFNLKLSIPQQPVSLNFSIGLDPAVFRPDRGDGVGFQIDLQIGTATNRIFSKYINPKQNQCDRKWFDESIDLRPWAGKDVIFKFSTNGGPAGNISWDWAYWGNIQLRSTPNNTQPNKTSNNGTLYNLDYQDQYAAIYKNADVFPRAFVVYNILNVANFNDSLELLSEPNINLWHTAIVENLPPELEKIINQTNQSLQPVSGTANLVSSGEIDVQVNTKAPGLLIVSDQYYPGWEAFVDGKSVPIYAVDGIFRGVFLDEGIHIVHFLYRPLSFIIGGIISIASILFTIIFAVIYSRKSKYHE